jgi:endonuclease/exonuclease/phosphatase family metal-dependent hydrolase
MTRLAQILILLSLVVPARPLAAQTPAADRALLPLTLRVATFNVMAGGAATPEQIARLLEPLELDVLTLTETPSDDWTEDVGKRLGLKHRSIGRISSANHPKKHKAVLSRWPIVAQGEVELLGDGWQPASAVRVELEIAGRRLAVYSLHIPGHSGRPDVPPGAWQGLLDELAREPVAATLVMGDFNNRPDDAVMRRLDDAGWRATWRDLPPLPVGATTLAPPKPAKVVDHVLYRRHTGMLVTGGGILTPPTEWSDHLPVWAELTWTPPAPLSPERQGAWDRVAARLADPSLLAVDSPRVYRNEHLTGISFPVGGIGAGMIQFDGRGVAHAWQIFNNFEPIALPQRLMAIRVTAAGQVPVVRGLQTAPAGPFQPMQSLEFTGQYPVGRYRFIDPHLPADVSMEILNPLVPFHEKESSIPCAIWTVTVSNPSPQPLEVQLLATQPNVTGFGDRIRYQHDLLGGYSATALAAPHLPTKPTGPRAGRPGQSRPGLPATWDPCEIRPSPRSWRSGPRRR